MACESCRRSLHPYLRRAAAFWSILRKWRKQWDGPTREMATLENATATALDPLICPSGASPYSQVPIRKSHSCSFLVDPVLSSEVRPLADQRMINLCSSTRALSTRNNENSLIASRKSARICLSTVSYFDISGLRPEHRSGGHMRAGTSRDAGG